MPDGASILGALPIGLILFAGMYLGFKRRQLGFQKARAEMPRVAERLGLTHVPSVHEGLIGKIRGRIGNIGVSVDPDEQMRIAIELPRALPIVLRSYERTRLPPQGMERLDTGRAGIDGVFKERYASPELADALYADPDPLERALARFRGDFAARLKDFVVTSEGAYCVFDFGKPPHLPPDLVEGVVRDLVRLTEVLEAAARRAEVPSVTAMAPA